MDKLTIEKIQAVRAVMESMDISLNELVQNAELIGLLRTRLLRGLLKKNEIAQLLSEMPDFKPKSAEHNSCKMLHFATHGSTGVEYALNGGEVIGPVIKNKNKNIHYVLALKNIARNLRIKEAEELAKAQECVCGINWIVPSDEHFKAIFSNMDKINRFIEVHGGDKIGSIPFLSTTYQGNMPSKWNVRLILPLP